MRVWKPSDNPSVSWWAALGEGVPSSARKNPELWGFEPLPRQVSKGAYSTAVPLVSGTKCLGVLHLAPGPNPFPIDHWYPQGFTAACSYASPNETGRPREPRLLGLSMGVFKIPVNQQDEYINGSFYLQGTHAPIGLTALYLGAMQAGAAHPFSSRAAWP